MRSDQTMTGNTYWWSNIFIFWWAFSIKYLMPFLLWYLMMWNFAGDVASIKENGRGYSGYNVFWQLMGFLYPLIGLCCFFIPMCSPPEAETRNRKTLDFMRETNSSEEAKEKKYR